MSNESSPPRNLQHETFLSEASAAVIECAKILADARLSSSVDVTDVLAAMLVVGLDRLSKYWEDPEEFDRLVTTELHIGAVVQELRRRDWQVIFSNRIRAGLFFKELSPPCKTVYFRAKELAQPVSAAPSGPKAFVFPEHILLAIAEQGGSHIVSRLLASGLRVDALRQDVEQGIH